jgi:hypothetical protein
MICEVEGAAEDVVIDQHDLLVVSLEVAARALTQQGVFHVPEEGLVPDAQAACRLHLTDPFLVRVIAEVIYDQVDFDPAFCSVS